MKRQRHSIRLRDYDYAQAGAYFVTICTRDRECLLGEIIDDEVALSPYGIVVAESWTWLTRQYPTAKIDRWIIMPNHLHGIIYVDQGGSRTAPTSDKKPLKPLGRLIGAFKTISTKRINDLRRTPGVPLWQRNYYERVIRNDAELDRIRRYIEDNPIQWEIDRENPAAKPATDAEPWQM